MKSKIKKTGLLPSLLFITLYANAQMQKGKASYYADKFEGSSTASGEQYVSSKFTAAHRTLPFGTRIKVTNLLNEESVVVTVNDRGPFVENRVVDLSKAAADKLRFLNQGVADVQLEVINDAGNTNETPPVTTPSLAVEEKEFYEFNVFRINPEGIGVQLGTYHELINVMNVVDKLKTTYYNKIAVQVKNLNGTKYYSIILVGFSTRERAQLLIDDFRKTFPDAFIVDLNK